MLKYADILKIAKDPDDKYHDLRRRFFVDEYTDPGEDLEALPDDLEEKDIESWNTFCENTEKEAMLKELKILKNDLLDKFSFKPNLF